MKKTTDNKSTLKMTDSGLRTRHPWEFKSYFRARAFGWRGSQLAIKRLKGALKEINQTNKKSPLLAAEGAIFLMSRFWPAFEYIDTSSGSLGNAVYYAMEKLLTIIIKAPAELSMRQHWLDILWQVLQEDGVDYVYLITEYWGELSGFVEEASRRADDFLALLKGQWAGNNSIMYYDDACLSALFYAKRYDEILPLLELAPHPSWRLRKVGAEVLALTDPDKAIAYAEQTRPIINTSQYSIDRFCEKVLLNAGRLEEGYQRYAISANRANTYLAWFNSIKKKYGAIRKDEQLLLDLINKKIVEPGKWFATANKLKFYDLALTLIQESPAEPSTLNRAAKANLESNPSYALEVSWAALHWMIQGFGYEVITTDVYSALSVIRDAAKTLEKWDAVKVNLTKIVNNNIPGFYSEIIVRYVRDE